MSAVTLNRHKLHTAVPGGCSDFQSDYLPITKNE